MSFKEETLLSSKVTGEGESLIILHGLFGMGENWTRFSKKWSERYQVHLLDLRNHGYSFHSPQMDYEDISSDIKRYLDHHQIRKIFILGHSMGGKAAMHFSAKYPEYLNKAIIVDIAPKAYDVSYQNSIFEGLLSFDPSLISRKAEAYNWMEKHIQSKETISFLLKSLKRLDSGGYQWLFNLKALHENLGRLLSFQKITTVEIPTLFIRGENSGYISKSDEELIDKIFKKSDIISIPNTGHWVHAENPSDFYEVSNQFLSI